MTKIVLIGAGNLATQLGSSLKEHNIVVVQVYSRTLESAQSLGKLLDAPYTNCIADLQADADIYIFAIKDDILSDVIRQIPSNKALWLHTAGSISMNVFEGHVTNYGVLYPFQTFSKTRIVDFEQIPIFIEASNEDSYSKLEKLASKISQSVEKLSSDKRQYLHLTGVLACNFVNHLYHISSNILAENDISFSAILPLIEETASKVKEKSPAEAQTGPALRMDMNVIDKHLSLLKSENWKEIYRLMSDDIYRMNKK